MSDWGPRDDKSRDLGIIMTESMTEICTTEYDISGLVQIQTIGQGL